MNTDFRWFVVKKDSCYNKRFEILAGFYSLEYANRFREYISIIDFGENILSSNCRPYYTLMKKEEIEGETQE